MTSLSKLMETKSNVPRMTLLHFMVDEVNTKNQKVLDFVPQLQGNLKASSRYVVYHMPLALYTKRIGQDNNVI